MGNSIANQAAWTADGRFNFESLWNKIPFVKDVNKRFANQRRAAANKERKPRRFERTYQLLPDTTVNIKHNLRSTRVKVVAKTESGTPFPVKTKVVDANTLTVLTKGDQSLKFTIEEIIKEEKSVWRDVLEYTTRFVISPRTFSIRYRNTRSLNVPLYNPTVGNVFGQSTSYGPMAPGLGFAFGFEGEGFIDRALERGWLITDDGQTSPAIISRTNELNLEASIEPVKSLKIQLTMNRTDNRTRQVQFMYTDMPTTMSGSFTMTHMAIGSALSFSSPDNGYASTPFTEFLNNIPIVRERVEREYIGLRYPTGGFMTGLPSAGQPFNPEIGTIGETSSDVLIPAFVAAYTKKNPRKTWLNPFPSFSAVLPNWRITYDGLVNLGNMRKFFKTFSLNHAYQCTYSVGSYSSYLNWISADGSTMGFTLDELTGRPIPSSPYNISAVAITEKFAPLFGVNCTLQNDLRLTAEYRDARTLTLNSAAGQVVEANTKGIKIGAGYKIVGFNTFLKMKGSQTGVSNDLTVNADFAIDHNQALIRRIESNYTQPTSGTKSFTLNFTASYILSKRLTLGAYFDHRVNTPVVTTSSYPTSNTSYGLSLNLSLAR